MTRSKTNKQSGAAFIAALVAIVVIGIIITTFGEQLSSRLRMEQVRIEQRNAEKMAQAGIARALVAIQTANENYTTSTDEWWELGTAGSTLFEVGKGSFRMEIVDAGTFVNVNTATEEQLRRMYLSDEQIASLLDWRSAELQPRALGAKDEFYNQLTNPYNTKLRAIDTIDELLLIKDFTPDSIFLPPVNVTGTLLVPGTPEDQPAFIDLITTASLSKNVRSDGTARVNVNTATPQQLLQAGFDIQLIQAIIQQRNSVGTFTSLGQVFNTPGLTNDQAESVLNNLTVTADTYVTGKININTATEAVLNTIPNIPTDMVSDILSRQGTIQDLGELATLPGSNTQVLTDIADFFTVNSQSYLVRIIGQYGSATYPIIATVTLDEGVPKIKRIQLPYFPDFLEKWEWSEETTTTTTLVAE